MATLSTDCDSKGVGTGAAEELVTPTSVIREAETPACCGPAKIEVCCEPEEKSTCCEQVIDAPSSCGCA